MFTLSCWFDQKLELRFMAVLVLLKIKFRHAQISGFKIGIPMSQTVYQPLIESTNLKKSYSQISEKHD